jgi:hypothetical protein
MRTSRYAVVVPATLNNVPDVLAVDLEVGGKIPAEVRYSDDNETPGWVSRGVGEVDCREEDENHNKSVEIAG